EGSIAGPAASRQTQPRTATGPARPYVIKDELQQEWSMNCQDIGLMLDDTDIRQLDAVRRHAVQAHLATCSSCAESWNAHLRLLRITIPAVPEALIAG